MFKLFNDYHLSKLLKKVKRNAGIIFSLYLVIIVGGLISAIIFKNGYDKNWFIPFAFILAAIPSIPGILLLCYDYLRHKNKQYSVFLIQKEVSIDVLDQELRSCEAIGNALGVSERYLCSVMSSFYIPFMIPIIEIKAIYSMRRWRKRRLLCDDGIYVITKNNKVFKLPFRFRLIKQKGGLGIHEGRPGLDEWVFLEIKKYAPDAFYGVVHGMLLPTKNMNELEGFVFSPTSTNVP